MTRPGAALVTSAALVLLAATLAAGLAGCGRGGAPSPEPLSGGTTEHTITVDGVERSYLLTVPGGLAAEAPLVVMMHGGLGSAGQARESYGWDQLATSAGVVVAYPDGLGRAWNAGDGCCGRPGESGTDDVAFITAMIADIEATIGADSGANAGADAGAGLSIDPARIFATGMSNGATMSYRLACDTDVFAAIAPVAGTLLGDCADPAPTAVMHVHGLADDAVRFDGAQGTGTARVDGMPIAELNALWRAVDDCAEPTVTTDAAVTTSVADCAATRTVELITIDGAGHQWPGSTMTDAQKRRGADEPSTALDATQAIWEFFVAHPKP